MEIIQPGWGACRVGVDPNSRARLLHGRHVEGHAGADLAGIIYQVRSLPR